MATDSGKNQRACPALGRGISSRRCGGERGTKIACPADCGFSPYALANYDEALKLERTLSGHLDRSCGLTEPLVGVFTPLLVSSCYRIVRLPLIPPRTLEPRVESRDEKQIAMGRHAGDPARPAKSSRCSKLEGHLRPHREMARRRVLRGWSESCCCAVYVGCAIQPRLALYFERFRRFLAAGQCTQTVLGAGHFLK